MSLTQIDHLALESNNISNSVQWYTKKFNCSVKYQDDTWAMLEFANISLALVTPGQHPSHFAIVDSDISASKNLQYHRDGVGFIYESDPDNNVVEIMNQGTSK